MICRLSLVTCTYTPLHYYARREKITRKRRRRRNRQHKKKQQTQDTAHHHITTSPPPAQIKSPAKAHPRRRRHLDASRGFAIAEVGRACRLGFRFVCSFRVFGKRVRFVASRFYKIKYTRKWNMMPNCGGGSIIPGTLGTVSLLLCAQIALHRVAAGTKKKKRNLSRYRE